jgi:hypothetical protein
MSRQLKLILFVLVFNVIGAAMGGANYRSDCGRSSAAESADMMAQADDP